MHFSQWSTLKTSIFSWRGTGPFFNGHFKPKNVKIGPIISSWGAAQNMKIFFLKRYYIIFSYRIYRSINRNFLYLKMAPKVAMRLIISTQYHDDSHAEFHDDSCADIWHQCNHAVVRHGYPKVKVSDSHLILWGFVCLMVCLLLISIRCPLICE